MNAPFTALACLALGLGLPHPGLAEEKDAAFSVSHPLPTPPGHIVVPLKLAGTERLFIFDTGADRTFIDPSLHTADMAILGNSKMIDASGNKTDAKLIQLPGLIDGPHTFPSKPGGLVSTAVLTLYLGRLVAGALGVAQLGDAKIFLDYQAGQLTIHNGGWKLPPEKITEVALNPGDGALRFTHTLGDRPITFTVDTGANITITLSAADFTALVESGLIQETAAPGRNVSAVQSYPTRKGIFQGGTLMGKELKGIRVATGSGVIGLAWLCGFRTEFDLKARTMRYLPIENPQEPIVRDLMLGAILNYKDGKAIVARLQPGGQGLFEKAGLKIGDLLLRIDTLENAELHDDAVTKLVAAKAGQPIEIEYQRGGSATPSKISLTLPPLITEWGKHRLRPAE